MQRLDEAIREWNLLGFVRVRTTMSYQVPQNPRRSQTQPSSITVSARENMLHQPDAASDMPSAEVNLLKRPPTREEEKTQGSSPISAAGQRIFRPPSSADFRAKLSFEPTKKQKSSS